MSYTKDRKLKCDMDKDCTKEVSHIDHKGYIYCTEHGLYRKCWGTNCRKLRPHELKRLINGETVKKY